MAKDNPEWEDPWEANPYHTGSFTGRKGNKGKAVWNPITQKIEKMTLEEYQDMTSAYRKEHGEKMIIPYENVFGENVFGYRPEETHMGMTPAGESTLISGPDPFAGNRPTINNPVNNTPVPDMIPNPDFDPDQVPKAPPPQEGGPAFVYPYGGKPKDAWDKKISSFTPEEYEEWTKNVNKTLEENNSDPWEAPTGGVLGSVFDDFKNWDSGYGEPDQTNFSTDFRLGEDSPWGNKGIEGGNRDFYRKQLNNLRAQEQGYQDQSIAAALRRHAAANQPAELPADPWSWAYGGKGLPEVKVGGGTIEPDSGGGDPFLPPSGNPPAYSLRSNIIPGETSNADIARLYSNKSEDELRPWFEDQMDKHGSSWENQYNWSLAGSPQELISTLSSNTDLLAAENYDWLSKMYTDMFIQEGVETPEFGGPSPAPGYATPI